MASWGGCASEHRYTPRPDRRTELRQAADRLAEARDELTPPAGDDRAGG